MNKQKLTSMEVFLVKSSYLLDNYLHYKIFKTRKQADDCARSILLGMINDRYGESYETMWQVPNEFQNSVVIGIDQFGNGIYTFEDDFVASITRLSSE